MADTKKFIVQTKIWHSAQDKFYEAGQVIPLDHLDDVKIEILLNQKAIRRAEETVELKMQSQSKSGEKG